MAETVAARGHTRSMLKQRGAAVGIAGTPVQVRNPDATGLSITEGAYLSSPLPIAGFGIIDADSLDEAIALVSATPCAVAHGRSRCGRCSSAKPPVKSGDSESLSSGLIPERLLR